MDRILEISFEIISLVGSARSCFVEAIQEAKQGNFQKSDELMQEGRDIYGKGHLVHTDLIQKEAGGEHVEFNMIFMHAEDQMMSAEVIQLMAEELIELYKKGKE